MDHIAIMNKKWKLIEKILSGEKDIESRWYLTKRTPWDKIKAGDTVYFKDCAEPVTAKAQVKKVLQFDNLTPAKVTDILGRYGRQIWPGPLEGFFENIKEKKYCILVFLENPRRIEPFNIDKTGFGNAAAWLTVDDIDRIKI